MQNGIALHTDNIWLDGDTAAVELSTHSITKDGTPFNNRYCWVCRFDEDKIVEVRAYLDSALVKQVIEESGN
jgi:ketosteroid isomerase-like protein